MLNGVFSVPPEKVHDLEHLLEIFAARIDETPFDEYYSEEGRPTCTTRRTTGVRYLTNAFRESDDSFVGRWIDDLCCQCFCGFAKTQRQCSINLSSLSQWRKRLGIDRLKMTLQVTL